MEADYLTSGDLAMWESNRHCYKHRDGMAATGIGLAAGLGGGALLLAAAGIWGINQASKARSEGASKAIDILAQTQLQERVSREGWQNNHAPTISQYVDAPGQALTRCRTPKQSRWLRRSMAIRGSTPPLEGAISSAWRGIPPRSLVVATRARVSPSGVGRESVPPLTLKTATICYSLKKSITIWTQSAQHPKTP